MMTVIQNDYLRQLTCAIASYRQPLSYALIKDLWLLSDRIAFYRQPLSYAPQLARR